MILGGAVSLSAASCVRDNVERHQTERREAFDLLTEGQVLKEQGDYRLALDKFQEASRVSERPVVYYEMGHTHYLLGNNEEAANYYRRALDLSPDYTLAQADLDLVEQKLKREGITPPAAPPPIETTTKSNIEPEPVLETVETETVVTQTTEAKEQQTRADMAEESPTKIELSDIPEAVEEESTSEDENPRIADIVPIPEAPGAKSGTTGSPNPFGGIAGAFGGLTGEKQLAEASLEDIDPAEARRVVFPELDTDREFDPDAERIQAMSAQELGRFDEASRGWARILNADPTDIEARLSLANALHRSGRSRRAEEEYQRAASYAPDNPAVFFDMANFYVRIKEDTKARDAFNRVLELEPGHVRARNNLGALQIKLGNSDLAIPLLQKVLEAEPAFPLAWLNLALAQDNAGYPSSAISESLENYLRLSKEPDAAAEIWLSKLRSEIAAGNR